MRQWRLAIQRLRQRPWLTRLVGVCATLYLAKFFIGHFSGPRYEPDQIIHLYANRFGTLARPSVNFPYQQLPFCDNHRAPEPLSWQSVLAGDRRTRLPSYGNITFRNKLPVAQLACSRQLNTANLEFLRQLIRQRMVMEYYIDDLPLRMYIGTVGNQGWYDFSVDRCEEPAGEDESLYLLPHTHFILGHFGENRLTSARLVTEFDRKVDITKADSLLVNFTYSVEWRNEKFLEFPGRHSRYFRIFLFVAEWLKGQHKNLAGIWGKCSLCGMILALARYSYFLGGVESYKASRLVDWRTELSVWPPKMGESAGWNAVVLLGLQLNCVLLLQYLLVWLRLTSPMIRGSLWQSLLTIYLVTCPATGYVTARRFVPWWYIPVAVIVCIGSVWSFTQARLPQDAAGRFPVWASALMILGAGGGSLLCTRVGAQLCKPMKHAREAKQLSSWIDKAPFFFLGLLPYYFWSEHASYALECLWGRQFHVHVTLLCNAWVYSSLTVALGSLGMHQILQTQPRTGVDADAQSFDQLKSSFLAGIVVGGCFLLHSFRYFFAESCIFGRDPGGAQSAFFFGYTALISICVSLVYGSFAACVTFAWQRHKIALARRIRYAVDDGKRKARLLISLVRQSIYFGEQGDIPPALRSTRDD